MYTRSSNFRNSSHVRLKKKGRIKCSRNKHHTQSRNYICYALFLLYIYPNKQHTESCKTFLSIPVKFIWKLSHSHVSFASPMNQGMDMSPPPLMAPPMKKKSYPSMTFFWGRKALVLFKYWPGDSRGMYVLALIVVFLLAAGAEMISSHRLDRLTHNKGLAQTALHMFRVGLMYILMLSVMSFNGGIFIAACVGHAVGFLLFRSAIFAKQQEETVPCKGRPFREETVP